MAASASAGAESSTKPSDSQAYTLLQRKQQAEHHPVFRLLLINSETT